MRLIGTAVMSLAVVARGLGAQPADTVARLDAMMKHLVHARSGGIWPGFRADTIPVAFLSYGVAKLVAPRVF